MALEHEDEGIDPTVEAEFSTPLARAGTFEVTEDGELVAPYWPGSAERHPYEYINPLLRDE